MNRSDPLKLEAVCRDTSALLCEVTVCSEVQRAVREGLTQVFGDDAELKRVAVRSSAAGKLNLLSLLCCLVSLFVFLDARNYFYSKLCHILSVSVYLL